MADHPRLSVVVPFQDVESYLAECLESIARQSFRDFEVILVDDGSTDRSTEIVAEFCAADPRFRLIRQESHGPGHARNTGLRAMHPRGEFVAFVDGDDVIPEYAYELLVRTLEESGSDFVSGNVQMMNSTKKWQSPLHKTPMQKNRRGTHITRFDALIYDRTVWNKLFRRSFWDHHFIAFPEGVLYEDSWVNMFAHFRAAKVDVLTDIVYYWRRREGGAAPSITQRHTELSNLRDRVAAVQSVSRFLAERRSRLYEESKRKYDLACLKSDLMLHLKVLPDADEEYQQAFMGWVNEFLDEADPTIIDELPADARVKWLLVREGRLPELLEVIRFERRGGPMPVQRRFRRYLKYPYLGDREVGLDKKAYRLDKEFSLHGSLDAARWSANGQLLSLSGSAYVRFINVHKKHMSVKAIALRNKKQGRMVLTTAKTTYAPQATEQSNQNRYCYDWAGFEAKIDITRLKRKGQWVEGTWDVAAGVLSRGLFRYRGIDRGSAGSAANPPYRYVDKNTRVLPVFLQGKLKLRVEIVRCRITGHRVSGDHLELSGVYLGPKVPEWGKLRVTSMGGTGQHEAWAHFGAGGDGWCTFTARIPLRVLIPGHRADAQAGADVPQSWNMGGNGWKTTFHVEGRKMTIYPVVAEETPDGHYRMPAALQTGEGDREVVVHRNGSGYLVVFERATLPMASDVTWGEDGSWRSRAATWPPTGSPRASTATPISSCAPGRTERSAPSRSTGTAPPSVPSWHPPPCGPWPARSRWPPGAGTSSCAARTSPRWPARTASKTSWSRSSSPSSSPSRRTTRRTSAATNSRPRPTTGSPSWCTPRCRTTPAAPTVRSCCAPRPTRPRAARTYAPRSSWTPSRAPSTPTAPAPCTRNWCAGASN